MVEIGSAANDDDDDDDGPPSADDGDTVSDAIQRNDDECDDGCSRR